MKKLKRSTFEVWDRPMKTKIWICKIGECSEEELETFQKSGQDVPMRKAVREAYKRITGKEPNFIFSGWIGELNEFERNVVKMKIKNP